MRRWQTILAPVCVTMLVATLATWILLCFLAVRDHLGPWHLTVRDAHGIITATGQLNLKATRWRMVWTAAPPYVGFEPRLVYEAGWIRLTAAAFPTMTDFPSEGSIGQLVSQHYLPATDGFICSASCSSRGITDLTWNFHAADPVVTFIVYGSSAVAIPLPVQGTLSR